MQSVYSVGQVNTYIKNMFTQDFVLNRIMVGGEISNCKYHTSGHIYFSLKDKTGAIACVMFAGHRRTGLAFALKDGQRVVVKGSVNVYERDGKYQLYAKEIRLEGMGDLYEKYLALKKELEEMGMFAQEYKQPIPKYIKKLGIVTASTGAAVRDIINIASRRNPYVQLILYPTLVQGEGAVQSIVKGIETLDKAGVDTMIVGRGGGSIEDLWAFNSEEVARAVFYCKTPVISAVGHETDTTIIDFVADLRAPTPSAAAELAVYDYRVLYEQMYTYRRKLNQSLENKLELYRSKLKRYEMNLNYLSPQNQIREKRQFLIEKEEKLDVLIQQIITAYRHRLHLYIERFNGLSPLAKLNQGYSYVTVKNQESVTSVSQVEIGDTVRIQVADGDMDAEVVKKSQINREELFINNEVINNGKR